MEVTGLLAPGGIRLGAELHHKEQVLAALADLALSSGTVTDREAFLKGLTAREEEAGTNFGGGLAVPHAQGPFAARPAVLALVLKQGVSWGTGPNGEPCDVFFCIAAPAAGGEYLQTLACLMGALRLKGLGDQLRGARTPEEFTEYLRAAGCAAEAGNGQNCGPARILAVTACPTGIAHTYLAADALQKAAVSLGVPIKVETNGSIGVQNALTEEDIQNCDAVIVAADKEVEVTRFAGKRVIFAPVSAGVYHAEQLIRRAIAGEAPVYHPDNDLMAGEILPAAGRAGIFYRHLMNGVAHMLPFVVAGGVLTALSLLLDDLNLNPLNFGGNIPIAAFLQQIGKLAFGFMMPVAAGYIARSIAGLPALSVGFVGGALAAYGANFNDLAGKYSATGGFLGAILAGFLAGYIVRLMQYITHKMPAGFAPLKPTLIYPVVGVLTVSIVICSLNPLLGQVNAWIETSLHSLQGGSRVVYGAVLGAMMALDMGGPVNKAAYVFATAALASGNLDVMAAVMAGGMAPPLAMALCTTFFPKGFPPAAKRTGNVAYIMGLCFITEGAVPFAVADPLRAVPSCVLSGALAGSMSMLFGCTLGAPQGGIFVLPLAGKPILFLIAIAIGSLAGAFFYALLRALIPRKDPTEYPKNN